ncbi:DAO-domain-containing protein [Calocera viscosa TUFC12733]|uniref:DAO-domain-containing protein n=1 Tax=Calocera viscosa (strain TUFC12733) TaxID=1330018 RepID=A0A167LS64_CALVF|nr:DAO-domain-containing protein [Calocera viscosa TUFC12733]
MPLTRRTPRKPPVGCTPSEAVAHSAAFIQWICVPYSELEVPITRPNSNRNMASGLAPTLRPLSEGMEVDAKPATLPHKKPSVSFWTARARQSDLIGHAAPFPHEADCVIIGSGMSGTLAAYFILLAEPDLPHGVVMLEAREAINAATACNGGHCRPDCYRGYSPYKKLVGKVQAMKILKNEMDTLHLVEKLVSEENIDCDFWRGRSFDAMMTDDCTADFRSSYDEYIKDAGNIDQVEWIEDKAAAQKATRLVNVKAAASFPASSFYPYKFTSHLLKRAMSMGLNLQIHTPATAVTAGDGFWMIDTPSGTIRTHKVLHATNGYASAIFPEFVGKIVPYYGQCSSIIPTKAFSGKNMLKHTMSLYEHRGDSTYLIQRSTDGTIILGGGEFVYREEHINNCDDSKVMPAITELLRNVMKDNFDGWGEEAHGEGFERDWAGIQGYANRSGILNCNAQLTSRSVDRRWSALYRRLSRKRRPVRVRRLSRSRYGAYCDLRKRGGYVDVGAALGGHRIARVLPDYQGTTGPQGQDVRT